MKSQWQKVVWAHECDEEGNCPKCGIDYAECPCPGPMQEEEYEYQERKDALYARRLEPPEKKTPKRKLKS